MCGVKNNEPPAKPAVRGRLWRRGSDDSDVLGLVPLPAGPDVELDCLTLIEGLVAIPLDVGEVDEHVVSVLTRDEAVALLGVEELHSSSSQCTLFLRAEPIRATNSAVNVAERNATTCSGT